MPCSGSSTIVKPTGSPSGSKHPPSTKGGSSAGTSGSTSALGEPHVGGAAPAVAGARTRSTSGRAASSSAGGMPRASSHLRRFASGISPRSERSKSLSIGAVLIGRSTERARIEALIDAAHRGNGGALMLRGEPGVGKTALLWHARDRAYDMLVLTAQGVETESELPFAGLSQLLGPVLGRAVALPLPQRRALEVALGFGGARQGEPFAAYVAALALLAQVAETRPVLAVVDDAHWLDTASAEALAFAARRLGASRSRCCSPSARRAWRAHSSRRPRSTGSTTRPSRRSSGASRTSTPPPAVHRRLHRDTGGNPLAIIELAGTLSDRQLTGAEPLPEPLPAGSALERSFGERLDALPDAVRGALLIAAADEQRETGLLTRALRLRGLALPDLAPAEAAGHVTIAGGRLDFRHPLLRSAAYYGAPPPARRDAHAALAAALDGDPRARARRAFHRAAASAGPDEDVACELDAVAADALSRPAPVAAAHAFAAAARLSADDATRMPRLIEAGRAFYVGGELAQALETLDAALVGHDRSLRAGGPPAAARPVPGAAHPARRDARAAARRGRSRPAVRRRARRMPAARRVPRGDHDRRAARGAAAGRARLARRPCCRWNPPRSSARSCSAPRWCCAARRSGRRAPARGAPAARDRRAVADGLVRRAGRACPSSGSSTTTTRAGCSSPRPTRIRAKGALTALPHALVVLAHAEFHLGDWTRGARTRGRGPGALVRARSADHAHPAARSSSASSTARRVGSTARAAGSRRRTAWAASAEVGSTRHDGRLGARPRRAERRRPRRRDRASSRPPARSASSVGWRSPAWRRGPRISPRPTSAPAARPRRRRRSASSPRRPRRPAGGSRTPASPAAGG